MREGVIARVANVMKSPAVELPDPLNPPSAGAPARADDLIAQMAGDEINRLLADAQVEAEPTAEAPAAPPNPAGLTPGDVLDLPGELNDAPVGPETISNELDQVFARQVSATGSETPTEQAAGQGDADAMSADGVTDLLGRLSAGEREESSGFAGTGTSVPVHQNNDGSVASEPARPSIPDNDRHSVTGTESPAPEITSVIEVQPLGPERRGSRILDWIMFPLDPFPDHIRDIIGKVAIMTAINAAAVLIYVLMFRKQ